MKRKYQRCRQRPDSIQGGINARHQAGPYLAAWFLLIAQFFLLSCSHRQTAHEVDDPHRLKELRTQFQQLSNWQHSIESIEARFWARLSHTRPAASGSAQSSDASQSFPGKFYFLRSGHREWFRFDVKDPIGNGVASILSVYFGSTRLVIWVLHARQIFAVASADTPTNQYINALSTLAPMVAGLAPSECLSGFNCDAQFEVIPGNRLVIRSAQWMSGVRKKNIIKLEHADYADLEEFDLPKKLTLSIDATEKSFELKLAIRDRMLKTCAADGLVNSGEKSSEKKCSAVSQSSSASTFPQWVDFDALPESCRSDAACVTRAVQEQVHKHFTGYRLVDSAVLSIFD